MTARTTLLTFALAALPCACVIDGVPLPDETKDNADTTGDTGPVAAPALQGIYATLASGVTVVFGVPGSVPAHATVVALSGSIQAQTASTDDGSFNLALIGASATAATATTATVIKLRVLVNGSDVGEGTVDIPHPDTQVAPDGTATVSNTPLTPKPATSIMRVNTTTVHLSFPAGSFAADASVAIADLDRGTTATASAAPDGGLETDVTAARGDTLYIVTISATAASSPYVLSAPQ